MKQHSHVWITLGLRRFNWPVCRHCGLIALRNDLTDRAKRMPCPGHEIEE